MPITSSSTFSSDRIGSGPAIWRRFATTLVAATILLFGGLAGIAVVLDPFDTGRFAVVRVRGVPDQGPRMAHASRGRDPQFDGAIIGNSHIQLVSPERLGSATGIRFVSLTVPATGPREQFALLDYFLRHRTSPVRALVFGIDAYWCTPDPELKNSTPFPFWLYDPSPITYLGGLIRYDTLERLPQRVQYALGLSGRRRARPDGYWDYEQDARWPAATAAVEVRLANRGTAGAMNLTGRFPAIDKLGLTLSRLPADLDVVLVRPPAYITAQPEPGTPAVQADAACLAALQRAAAGRPRTTVIDWQVDRPENRRADNYLDHTHYRGTLAKAVESDIVQALSRHSAEAER
jgi:hypothetical protein